ncbi:hypothetical protein I3842_05G083100 [Carya illinoinensis]|uniref:Uncharacterized protein n=1 Tax=Carya illinoinensis TaxID=32201 RepID=A0A922EYJ1_CARIL|nr:hypothetical protein I3842_05G083100 [Carya illinoinensis]
MKYSAPRIRSSPLVRTTRRRLHRFLLLRLLSPDCFPSYFNCERREKKTKQKDIFKVEAAYDMLLMQSLTQRRAGKVVNSGIRYADVKPVSAPRMGSMPQWLQAAVKNPPVSVETPSSGDLGIQAGVYGALMILTYVNGASSSLAAPYGADVPGLILAGSFGASLYFMTKQNVKLGKATVITIGGLVAGAVVGSAVESWLQVDVVPFLGINSPAAVISEFILFSQFLVSLCLR